MSRLQTHLQLIERDDPPLGSRRRLFFGWSRLPCCRGCGGVGHVCVCLAACRCIAVCFWRGRRPACAGSRLGGAIRSGGSCRWRLQADAAASEGASGVATAAGIAASAAAPLALDAVGETERAAPAASPGGVAGASASEASAAGESSMAAARASHSSAASSRALRTQSANADVQADEFPCCGVVRPERLSAAPSAQAHAHSLAIKCGLVRGTGGR